MKTQQRYHDGYVTSYGFMWKEVTEEVYEKLMVGAMDIEGKTRKQIKDMLENGQSVRWCESPNFFYDHSYGVIEIPKKEEIEVMVMCDCGHEVPQGQRMSASLGSSCPDCYDEMSS